MPTPAAPKSYPQAYNYGNLQQDLLNYTNRSDSLFINEIPVFINNAQLKIYKEATSLFEQQVSIAVSPFGNEASGLPLYRYPRDWQRTLRMQKSDTPFNVIQRRTYEFCVSYAEGISINNGNTNFPLFYSDYPYAGNSDSSDQTLNGGCTAQFVISPANSNISVTLFYIQWQFLDSDNQYSVSKLSQNAYNLLLYASLIETAPFLKDDERLQTWMALYQKELDSMNLQDNQRMMTRLSLRTLGD